MATGSKYPHVQVIGTDLAPAVMNENDIPSNCRFELDDVHRGLAHFYDQMDLVHMRAISAGVSPRCLLPMPRAPFHSSFSGTLLYHLKNNPQIANYPETIREIIRCLKPGGLLLLGEGDTEFYSEDQVHLAVPADPNCADPTQRGKSWMTQKAYGMYSSPSSAFIDTTLSACPMNLSYVLLQRS